MKVLLTSCGLETKCIQHKFLSFLTKDTKEVKALFIPTAANYPEAIQVLPKCLNDLLKCNIPSENITVYDLHKPMTLQQLKAYDVVYLCGGNTEYLLSRINEVAFNTVLMDYIKQDGVVLGVSAGSIVFAKNLEHNLGLLHRELDVHCDVDHSEPLGTIDPVDGERLCLSNYQAIVMEDEKTYIID